MWFEACVLPIKVSVMAWASVRAIFVDRSCVYNALSSLRKLQTSLHNATQIVSFSRSVGHDIIMHNLTGLPWPLELLASYANSEQHSAICRPPHNEAQIKHLPFV